MGQERVGTHRQNRPADAGALQSGAREYHVASLSPREVERLKQIERELTEETGEEIVVVAYQKDGA